MKIISNPTEIDNILINSMKTYSKYNIATAWASMGSEASLTLLKNKTRINKMVVGLHFYQTHPDFIEKFANTDNVRFILKTDGVFHPKVYLFYNSINDWQCLIGSANFTTSALTKNCELMVQIRSKDLDSKVVFTDILKTIDKYWLDAQVMNNSEIINYKNIWGKNKMKLESLKGTYGGTYSKNSIIKSNIFSLQWKEYYKKISDNFDSFNYRLDILEKINNYFRQNQSFADFNKLQRKRTAGLVTDDEGDWRCFGSMKGAGKFHNRINHNDSDIAKALDCIPLTGTIYENNYQKFVEIFKKAFPTGGVGIAVASRLLAMKRPDYFVCFDSQNRVGLCKNFAITGDINFETYWKNIIERIIDSVWWSSSIPRGKNEKRAWNARVAMIDIIFYKGLQ